MNQEAFLPKKQAQKIAGNKSDSTLWRWEKAGLFPKREKIGPNSTAYRKSLVDEWVADPMGWAEKNRAAA